MADLRVVAVLNTMKIMTGVTEPDITSGSCDVMISFFDIPDADFEGSRPIRDEVLIFLFNQILSDFSTNGQILQFLSIDFPGTIITDPLAVFFRSVQLP